MRLMWLTLITLIFFYFVPPSKLSRYVSSFTHGAPATEAVCKSLGREPCGYTEINEVILQATKRHHKETRLLQASDGHIFNLDTGNVVLPVLPAELTATQIEIWKTEIRERGDQSFISKLADNLGLTQIMSNFGTILIFAAWAIGFLFVAFLVIPFLWRFFLKRVAEFSNAVRGKKDDF